MVLIGLLVMLVFLSQGYVRCSALCGTSFGEAEVQF